MRNETGNGLSILLRIQNYGYQNYG